MGVVVFVFFLRVFWFGGMIRRIRLVGGRVMREGGAVLLRGSSLDGRVKGEGYAMNNALPGSRFNSGFEERI